MLLGQYLHRERSCAIDVCNDFLASSASPCLTSSPYCGKGLSKTAQSEPQVLDALDTLIEKFTGDEENAEEGW
jgi:hypothetical protein